MMTAEQAIARSVSHTEIVTIEYHAETAEDLSRLSDDSTETEKLTEYWGTDDDGHDWRVHVRRPDPKAAAKLARDLYRDDMSRADEVPVQRDGRKAYNRWLEGSSDACDTDTKDALLSVDRNDFAVAWEECVERDDIQCVVAAIANVADASVERDRVRITGYAPDSGDYGGDTGPGSEWDDERERRMADLRELLPDGWQAEWSDDDVLIERAD